MFEKQEFLKSALNDVQTGKIHCCVTQIFNESINVTNVTNTKLSSVFTAVLLKNVSEEGSCVVDFCCPLRLILGLYVLQTVFHALFFISTIISACLPCSCSQIYLSNC